MISKRMGRKSIVAATGAGQHGVATAAACAKLSLDCTIFMGTTDMVEPVEVSFKDASSQAIREWVGNLETSYYLTGTVVGPHPCPSMGVDPMLVGLFHEFIKDEDVRLIGVEAAGFGLDSGKHAATLARGDVGVYHGAMSYLLQDEEGQILRPHSIGVGLEYPGVGPVVSFLKEEGRAEFYTATDQGAVDGGLRSMEALDP
ncbi:hypothetical protein CRYUN_Cryun34aG0014800 [Craigia yunnanensis]